MIHEQENEPKSAKTKMKYEKPVLIELNLAKESESAKGIFSPNETTTFSAADPS
tara:strand:+ start:844 stop:1005 length:162 start_codon:yes stop_codon:yes gene_type:complete